MKRLSFFLTSALLLVLANACQQGIIDNQPEPSPFITMTVDAGTAGTKTAVQVDGSTYNVTWKAGDKINVAEIINANFSLSTPKPPAAYTLNQSDALAADATTASFNVSLENRATDVDNPNHDAFRYVAVYPWSSLYSVNWTGNNRAEWEAHWGNTTTPDHATVIVELYNHQRPSADSFDPAADLMVSNMVESPYPTQPTSLTLKFARVGTIAKITLKGLPAGRTVQSGTFSFPQTWPGADVIEYDPVLGKTGLFSKSSGQIDFEPEGVTVNGDGEAVIWLRTLSGKLSGWFNFDITVSDGGKGGGETERYEKRVDLDALSRTINFPESGLTKFSVTLEKHYDLVMDMESFDATETSLTLNMHYDLAGKPGTSVSYGLISFDPSVIAPEDISIATAAAPEDVIYLVPDGYGRVSYELTGLTPNTTYNFMPFIVVDGIEYHPEYSPISVQTLKHYDYTEPALVDLDLPSGTKWASFNLGSTEPLTAGYYYAWGEVRPTESFENDYSSKYWLQYTSSSVGKAYKYSANASYGYDNLVDMKTVLDPEDDAATVALGGEWRTPTNSDYVELFDNCTVSATEGGLIFTSKINGNSISFPTCGYYDGANKRSDYTYMMTSSLNYGYYLHDNNCAFVSLDIYSTPGCSTIDGISRGYRKYNIRPVKGGTGAGYIWTAHCVASEITSGTAKITGIFLTAEDLVNWQDYTYKAFIFTDPKGSSTERTIIRDGNYGETTFTNLTPGTTYYYYVYWDCRRWSDMYSTWLHSSGYSEVNSFVAE